MRPLASPTHPFAHRVVRGARSLMALVAIATPCAAQQSAASGTAHGAHVGPATLSPAEIEAFAKLSLAVSAARDSMQKQLAMPRNETPQAQQALREQLVTQIAEILRNAGVSDTAYRRRQLLVSTDSSARTLFDAAIAKLTGAPLPGQLMAAAAPVKVPDGPAGAHLGHVLNAFGDTPKGMGLLPTALAEAAVAQTHAALAARDLSNLAAMQMHVGHVMHAIDPTSVASGPGLGYGVKRAALGIATHIELAAKSPGAAEKITKHAIPAGASARNALQKADQILALGTKVRSATSASEAASLVSQLVSLVDELMAGKDVNGDGRVSAEQAEGGLQQCQEQVKLMVAEGPGDRR